MYQDPLELALLVAGGASTAIWVVWFTLAKVSDKVQYFFIKKTYEEDLKSLIADFLEKGEYNGALLGRWVDHLKFLSGFPYRWLRGVRSCLAEVHSRVEDHFDQEVEIAVDWEYPSTGQTRIKPRPWKYILLNEQGQEFAEYHDVSRFNWYEYDTLYRALTSYVAVASLLVITPDGRIKAKKERAEIYSRDEAWREQPTE